MGDYDPSLKILREMLALSIVNKLEECGFELLSNPREAFSLSRPELAERVYTRAVGDNDRIQVRVYTTVRGGKNGVPLSVRSEGKDAIRVCAVYETNSGGIKGLSKETRVNRTGNIDDIVDRMHQRMRSAYKTAVGGETCRKCSAPMFVSKNGSKCCAEICWKSSEEKRADEIAYKTRSRRRRRSNYYRKY